MTGISKVLEPKSLTPALHSSLLAFRAAFEKGRDVKSTLAEIVRNFGDQLPSTIGRADAEIAFVAGLNRWAKGSSFIQRLFWPPHNSARLLGTTPGLEYLFLFHRDGRLREQALGKVNGPLPNPFLVAAISWRLNDWVPQVRASAMECAKRCFVETQPDILAKFLVGSVPRQLNWGRWGNAQRDLIAKQLRRKDVTEALANVLRTAHAGPLPAALAHLVRYPEIDPHLEALANHALNPGVRAIALRSLIDAEARFVTGSHWRWIDKPMGIRRREPTIEYRPLEITADRRDLYARGAKDKSAVVRRTVLSGIIKHDLNRSECLKLAQSLVSDRSASVRERARFIVERGVKQS